MTDPVTDPVTDPDEVPLLRVVAGHPTAEELAALVVALTTLAPAPPPPGGSPPVRGWSHRAAGVRRSLRPGPGAWTLSGRGAAG